MIGTPTKKLIHSATWLSLKEICYIDANKVNRTWETCERNTPMVNGIFGVDIFARIKHPDEDQVILTRQYRPPLNKHVIEFPAGLLDKGETIEAAALRELLEETGYHGKVVHVSEPICLESGLTNECESFVHVEIDGSLFKEKPKQKLEEDEIIEVLLEPVQTLFSALQKYTKAGDIIDSKVYTFAYGYQAASKR